MKQLLLFFLICINVTLFGQKENNIWYFGDHVGLDFSNGAPFAITDGQLLQEEGCSTICDSLGNLLFYTSGEEVYNRNHVLMGLLLGGGYSSSQSALIVKKPNSNSTYYIFTTEENADWRGLQYSEVDMNMNGGLGGLVNTDLFIVPFTCEKQIAVQHQNGVDLWVVTHLFGSDAFHSYLVTSTGLNTTPVISNIGSVVSNSSINNSIGYMRVSLDGSKIAAAHTFQQQVELFDFDNSTGQLSNVDTSFNVLNKNFYGIEFSPNGKLLYLTARLPPWTHTFTHQYNLEAGSPAAVVNSEIIIDSTLGASGGLQMGPDFKIYRSIPLRDSISVIHNPNVLGFGCNYSKNEIYMEAAGGSCMHGMQNLVNSINGLTRIEAIEACPNDTSYFSFTSPYIIDSVAWNFDDLSSGVNNNSILTSPNHIFLAGGNYNVELIIYYDGTNDTIINTITINPLPTVIFPPFNPTTFCEGGNSVILNSGSPTGGLYSGIGVVASNFNPSLAGLGTHLISYIYTDTNGCTNSDTTAVIVDVCTSIADNENELEFLIYPNPNTGFFMIKKPLNCNKKIKINILDATAKIILEKVMSITEHILEIDISEYSNGIYYVHISINEKVSVHQILKK